MLQSNFVTYVINGDTNMPTHKIIRITAETHTKLKVYSAANNLPMGDVAETAINEFITKDVKPKRQTKAKK